MAPETPAIAYFSMEIALDPAIPTYSGGLGVLAGDLLRSAADLALPVTGVTLVSRQGYVRQRIVDGAQAEAPQPWDPAQHAVRAPAKVPVRIDGREVWVGAWEHAVCSDCVHGAPARVLLLDTDLPENAPEDRRLTDRLYGGDAAYRLRQEMVLGIGGVRLLEALGIAVRKYHLNEGHAAFLGVELLARELAAHPAADAGEAIDAVRARCVFTTHTPVASAMDQYPWSEALPALAGMLDAALLARVGGRDRLNMTLLALNLSGWVNGVAQRHAEVSRQLFPGYEMHAIDNGVHAFGWASDAHRALYAKYLPNWRHEPELLVQAGRIPAAEFAAAHRAAKLTLLDLARTAPGGAALRPERLTLGYARRMTGYKRPDLLFRDLPRLRRIAARYPLQVLYAGKAHPKDAQGKEAIGRIHAWAHELGAELPVVFLPDYGVETARALVAGSDVWLNTPLPPLEASGTSGMKAAVNGVPSLSILDGWWLAGCAEGLTGWTIDDMPGDENVAAQSLLDKLEQRVAPLFHAPGEGWSTLMRNVAATNGALFNSHRMLRRYVVEAYWR